MKKDELVKIVGVFLVAILLIPPVFADQNKELAETEYTIPDEREKTVSIVLQTSESENKIKEISLDKANMIKEELLDIEKEYSAEEKIRKQMEILHENELLPSAVKLDDYLKILHKLKTFSGFNKNLSQQLINTGYIFSGPSIESTFTLGGQTYQLQLFVGNVLEYFFDIELFDYQNNDTLNGTHFHSSAYSGPVFVGISPAASFITTLGIIISGPAFVYAPFINIRVLFSGVHLSAKIFECENPITVFDWHLTVALMGVLIYQTNN